MTSKRYRINKTLLMTDIVTKRW